jgi:hypothetical protein
MERGERGIPESQTPHEIIRFGELEFMMEIHVDGGNAKLRLRAARLAVGPVCQQAASGDLRRRRILGAEGRLARHNA